MHENDRMDARHVELVEKTTPYRGHFQVDRYRLRHRLFAGGMSRVLTRELFERGQVVAVLPVDVVRDQVVLIEQFRAGAYAVGWDPWLVECVAGVVEEGERPEQVAARESIEECGCELTRLHLVMRYLSSPGGTTETVSLFCGEVDASGATGVHGLAAEGEDIRVHAVSVADALRWLGEGRICNAKTIIVLQWLALHYQELKAKWR